MRFRFDTSPHVIQFNDSSPFTEGLSNLLAAMIQAPAIRAQAEEARLDREFRRNAMQADKDQPGGYNSGLLSKALEVTRVPVYDDAGQPTTTW